jgi:hypothetical protein
MKERYMAKEVAVPKILRELHGDRTSIVNLASTYLAGAVAGAISAVSLLGRSVAPWRAILAAIVVFDVAGGVVANLSEPTRRHYAQAGKKRIQFILLHVLHPAALTILFPGYWPCFLSCMAFTLGCCFALELVGEREDRQNIASAMVCAGIAGAFAAFKADAGILSAFAPLFMIKLILGFSVGAPKEA